jgi:4-amino-4-deoxy-L-arabinose transferase-like glycosyltransferase
MLDSFLNLSANLQIDSSWLFLILLWVLPWKGVALWRAARNSDKKWFVALFLLNTLAILEIIYIFVFSKTKQKTDVEPD